MTLTRRQFLLSSGAMTGALAGWSHWIEPGFLKDTTYQAAILPPGSQPLKLVHLSDFHAWDATPLSFIEHAIERTAAARPDLIALTGDFITHRIVDRAAYLHLLARLPEIAPTFASLGNHDGGSWAKLGGGLDTTAHIRRLLDEARIAVLLNEAVTFEAKRSTVRLVGLGDLWSNELEPEKAFQKSASAVDPVIVLSHNPDSKDVLTTYPWELLLAGHTHGGQVIVPVIGATPFAPVKDTRFLRGLHEWNGRLLHVNAGVGNLHGVRFNCRPEWVTLNLVAKMPVSTA